MKHFVITLALVLGVAIPGRAQSLLQDPLGPAFRLNERKELRAQLPPRSAAIFFPSNYKLAQVEPWDVMQIPGSGDFLYLTGLGANFSTHGALVILPEEVSWLGVKSWNFVFTYFEAEFEGDSGTGKLPVVEGAESFHLSEWPRFVKEVLGNENMSQILTRSISTLREMPPLADVVPSYVLNIYQQFPPHHVFDKKAWKLYQDIQDSNSENWESTRADILAQMAYFGSPLDSDPTLLRASEISDKEGWNSLQQELKGLKIEFEMLDSVMLKMYHDKSSKEIFYIRQDLPRWERTILAAINKVGPGVVPAEWVFSSAITTALSHQSDTKFRVSTGAKDEMPLMIGENDMAIVRASAETYLGFYSIARTIPAGRHFTEPQKKIHELTREFHEKFIAGLKPAVWSPQLSERITQEWVKALKDRGVITSDKVLKSVKIWFSVDVAGGGPEPCLQSSCMKEGTLLYVFTGISLPVTEGVAPEYANQSACFGDMIRLTATDSEYLTQLPRDAASMELMKITE